MNLSWLWGQAKVSFISHPQPIKLQSKDGNQRSLLDICEESAPPCNLNPWLFNGHMQTIWTVAFPEDVPIYYKRHIFDAEEVEYHGTFAVDFVVPPHKEADEISNSLLPPRTTYYSAEEFAGLGGEDEKPLVIVLHGLAGGSDEAYLRCALPPLIEAGWEACVVNSRGCAKSEITSGILYNARTTWDLRQVVKWARKKWPKRKLFGLGFSLGANMLANVGR